MSRGLGRRMPADWAHVDRYRVAVPTVVTAERALSLPAGYQARMDQGNVGSCVGWSSSWMMSILNRRFYDAPWLYDQAQRVDEYADTPPAEGTSVRAGMDVLRTQGHRRIYRGQPRPVALKDGIVANRWATTVDQVRACLAGGTPVVLGIDWYEGFFDPVVRHGERWLERSGPVAGGHAICAYAVSDRRQAVRLVNSWGLSYPPVWMSYRELASQLAAGGEATVVTDA